MTSNDYNLVMSHTVGIADLKAHLSEHLRKVRNGETLTVLDRDTPIAQIAPINVSAALEVRRATRKPAEVPLATAPSTRTDSLFVLLADRASR
jgi:antitoxin (DNA-binding transcriptional repressor) of toxin-antitoxin stability system